MRGREASSVPFIKDLVSKGVGVSVLTMLSVIDDVSSGVLCAIPFDGPGLRLHVDIVTPKEGYRSTAVDRFLEYLVDSSLQKKDTYDNLTLRTRNDLLES